VKLTEKQKRFADYYIETGNASEAYRKAYKCTEKTANVEGFKNLAKPSVKQYIDERMKEIESEKIANQKEIMEYYTSVMRGEETDEVPVPTKEGIQIAKVKVSVKDRNKAAEQLGKRYAMWTDKQQIEGAQPVQIVNDLDD
jgi:phage terminase small subunit